VAKLIIRNLVGENREFPLADRDLRVGRGEQNDVVLPDPEKGVSRFHAELRYENGLYVLVDANSPNGIWVNGRREAEIELRPGVEAVIGPYTLSVEKAAPATETVAVFAPTIVSTSATPVPSRPTVVPPAATTQAKTQLPTKTQPPKPTRPNRPSNALWIAAVVVLLVVTTVVATIGIRRRAQRIADVQKRVADQQVAQGEEQGRQLEQQTRQREEQVRQRLEEAQRLFDSHQLDDAKGELDRVSELDPSNATASQLREKIQVALNSLAPAPLTPKPAPARGTGAAGSSPPSVAKPPDTGLAKMLQERYEQGKQALLSGDYPKAIALLEAVLRDDPNYRDAAFLLGQARMAAQRDDTQAAAKKAEAAGDLPTALKLYLEAQKLSAANQEDVNRVRAVMTKAGTEAFSEAKSYYAFGQFEKALPLYQRAYQYLPESDPNRKTAKDRIDAISLRGRGQRNASPTDK
jgi:FHA domain-containing protein/type VI secretion system protein